MKNERECPESLLERPKKRANLSDAPEWTRSRSGTGSRSLKSVGADRFLQENANPAHEADPASPSRATAFVVMTGLSSRGTPSPVASGLPKGPAHHWRKITGHVRMPEQLQFPGLGIDPVHRPGGALRPRSAVCRLVSEAVESDCDVGFLHDEFQKNHFRGLTENNDIPALVEEPEPSHGRNQTSTAISAVKTKRAIFLTYDGLAYEIRGAEDVKRRRRGKELGEYFISDKKFCVVTSTNARKHVDIGKRIIVAITGILEDGIKLIKSVAEKLDPEAAEPEEVAAELHQRCRKQHKNSSTDWNNKEKVIGARSTCDFIVVGLTRDRRLQMFKIYETRSSGYVIKEEDRLAALGFGTSSIEEVFQKAIKEHGGEEFIDDLPDDGARELSRSSVDNSIEKDIECGGKPTTLIFRREEKKTPKNSGTSWRSMPLRN